MKYWWVNQNLTYKHEVHGSYLWSPKRTADDRVNIFYENMRLVMPGDLVFSFADTYIKAVGVVDGQAVSALKPAEFGSAGSGWGAEGWFVPTVFHQLGHPIRPKDFISILLPHLPKKYSPLQQNGNGNQGVYLASVPEALAMALIGLLGIEVKELSQRAGRTGSFSDSAAIGGLLADEALTSTQRSQVFQARIGQGLFRSRVAELERSCRITGIDDERFLIASHIKPWAKSNNSERLDGSNGLLLAPHIDRLFDQGYLTFTDAGVPMISPLLPSSIRLAWMARSEFPSRALSYNQRTYMEYHRDERYRR